MGLVTCDYDLILKLHAGGATSDPVLRQQSVGPDLVGLADEGFLDGFLSGRLPAEYDDVRATVAPCLAGAAETAHRGVDLEVALAVAAAGAQYTHTYRCTTERWGRTAQYWQLALAQQGQLADDAATVWSLVLQRRRAAAGWPLPPLCTPRVISSSLEAQGIRLLSTCTPDPDRPVLFERRIVLEILQQTIDAGCNEAGGALLGQLLRLPAPLPGTNTPLVTVFTAAVADQRHKGTPGALRFDPQALVDSSLECQRRGKGEAVLTAWHSHGWSSDCRHCTKPDCPLPHVGQVSLDDYRVLESLFPSKATLMPIAGRLPGAESSLPALLVYRWQGGVMRPLVWDLCETK